MCPGAVQSSRRPQSSSLSLFPDVAYSHQDAGGDGDLASSEQRQQKQHNGDHNEDEVKDDCGCGESHEDVDDDDDDDDDEEMEWLHRRGRHSSRYFVDRQMYLHSYKFHRQLSLQDRLKASLRRFRAAALAIVACNHIKAKPLARKFKDKLRRCCGGVARRKSSSLFGAIPVHL